MDAVQKLERDMFVDFMGESLDKSCMPRTWEDAGDLEVKYWRNLERAEQRETEVAIEAATIRKSISDERLDQMVTRAEMDAAIHALAVQVRDEAVAPLTNRLKAIEGDYLRWAGTWRANKEFALNSVVQDKGCLFVAVADGVSTRPGTGAGWRQMQKAESAK
jgi:hypothetical protein